MHLLRIPKKIDVKIDYQTVLAVVVVLTCLDAVGDTLRPDARAG